MPRAVLGDRDSSFVVTGMRYESQKRSEPDWITVDFTLDRVGQTIAASDAFLTAGDLLSVAVWLDELAQRASNEAGSSSHAKSGPTYHFDEPVELTARSWNAESVLLEMRWFDSPPWPVEEPTGGAPKLLLATNPGQLRAFAESLRQYSEILPDRGDEPGISGVVVIAVLLLILALIVLGAVTAVRWLIGLAI